jgi:hypothetical protein
MEPTRYRSRLIPSVSRLEQEISAMTKAEFWSIVVQGTAALASLFLAVLAIWGDWIRHRLLGPKLTINLLDSEGILTQITDGKSGRYYKLRVANERKWSPAKNVRVVLTEILKPAADNTLSPQVLSGPLQLTWQWLLPQYPTVGPEEICTFANLIKGHNFSLSPYIKPNNFVGFLEHKPN